MSSKDLTVSLPEDDLGRWFYARPGSCFSPGDRQHDYPAYLGAAHSSPYDRDAGTLLTGDQWTNALAGISRGEGILYQRFLGGGVRLDFDQYRELDIVQVFAWKLILGGSQTDGQASKTLASGYGLTPPFSPISKGDITLRPTYGALPFGTRRLDR